VPTLRSTLALLLVNLILVAVLAELAGLGVYYAQTGHLFYTHRPSHEIIEETARGQLTADGLHPYFGPLHKPGMRPESNNTGFTTSHPYPYIKVDPDEFLIGIFGGSVGELFCVGGATRMIEALSKHAFFAHKRVVPLCFSQEGYKQPQQVLVLSYFLTIGQQFDLVINIDGFNEVALSSRNHEQGRDISMPSPIHLNPVINLIDRATLTPDMIESLAAINRHKVVLNRLAGLIGRTRMASVGVALDRYSQWRTSQYRTELARFAGLPPASGDSSLVVVVPPLAGRDETNVYEDIAADWVRGSTAMHTLLAAQSVPYVHVLQPNQYFTRRRFGADEARVALNPDTPFKAAVERGYPALLRAADALRRRESFLDATTVFDQETAAVYEDDCCHYTELGNRLLADAIAARVLESGPWRAGAPR